MTLKAVTVALGWIQVELDKCGMKKGAAFQAHTCVVGTRIPGLVW